MATNTHTAEMKDKADDTFKKVQDAGSTVLQKGKEVAGAAYETAQSAVSAAGHAVDSATQSAGKGIKSAADSVRDMGPQSGMLGSATAGVAGALESTGSYLEDKGISGMAGDMTGLIRRNPVTAVLIGVGIGFLLARASRS